jgi:anti-sigma regulatory factor (Ser/Thr protein kinase)
VNAAASVTNPFVHEALFYRDTDEYQNGTLPFIRAGLDAGEPVMVAVPGPNIDVIRAGLNGSAGMVRFADMTQAGRNPGRIIPWVLNAFLDEHAGADRVRVIGEPIWAERSATEYPACVQHEALINLAFTGRAATILCPYDVQRLDPEVVADAESTHPILVDKAGKQASAAYGEPENVVAAFNWPLPSPPVPADTLVFGAGDLPRVRQFVVQHANWAGMSAQRVDDLEMAVNEVATNSVAHTTGPGTLRVWKETGTVVCEVRDPGPFDNVLAGRIPPPPGSPGGRGLLLVNHVCDLVRLYTHESGTVIRLHMSL